MERLVCLVIGYICGMFQTSYLYGRMHQIDIREHGSGNAGTTNALRTMGKKAAAITLLCDCLKCIVAVLIARIIYGNVYQDIMPLLSLYAAAGCILGHNFPAYLKFKGGKGIAASIGLALAIDWKLFVVGAVVFLTIYFITHYVSAGSVFGYLTIFTAMIVFGQKGDYHMAQRYLTEMYILMAALTALAVFRHRANIRRLLQGTESKVYLSNKKKEQR